MVHAEQEGDTQGVDNYDDSDDDSKRGEKQWEGETWWLE